MDLEQSTASHPNMTLEADIDQESVSTHMADLASLEPKIESDVFDDSDNELFQYIPLSTPTSIRLLEKQSTWLISLYTIVSLTPGVILSASTRTEPIDYSGDTSWPIFCNDKITFVRQNLHDALKKLATSHSVIVEQPDTRAQTRLHWAASTGDVDNVRHLLFNGADIASQDVDGRTPLDWAVRSGHLDVVKLMVRAENDKILADSYAASKSPEHLRHNRIFHTLNNLVQGMDTSKELPRSTRRPGVERNFIWIDALCINQDDDDERTAQVRIMGEIYSSSQSVVVWLGPDAEFTKPAVELIFGIANDRIDEKWKFFTGNDQHTPRLPGSFNAQEGLDMLGVSDVSDASWNCLASFFQLSWFQRAWIIQEIVLSQKLLFFNGSFIIPWDELYRASTLLWLSSWCLTLRQRVGATRTLGVGPCVWMKAQEGLEGGKGSPAINLLWRQLVRTTIAEASDPRDKVFSTLGFNTPPVNTTHPDATLVVDYSKSVQEVYTAAAKAVLLDATDLRPLSFVGDRTLRITSGLPSWAPDYNESHMRPATLIGAGLGQGDTQEFCFYNASGDLPRQLQFPTDSPNTCIMISGHEVDTVSRTGGSNDDQTIFGGQFIDWLDLVLSLPDNYAATNQVRAEVFWRTLIGNVSHGKYPAPTATEVDFQRFLFLKLTCYLLEHGIHSPASRAAFNEHARRMDELGIWPSDEEQLLITTEYRRGRERGEDLPFAPFTYNWRQTYSSRRLFRTESGYLGVGAQELREGDAVWIMPGSPVPYILRKLESGNYALIGEAYVHGIMQGELVGKEGWKTKEVLLE